MQNHVDAKNNGNAVKLTLTSKRTNSLRTDMLGAAVLKLFPHLTKESPNYTRLVLCMEELTVNATKKDEQFPVEIVFSKEKIDGHDIAKFTIKDSGKPFVVPESEDPLNTKGHGIGLTLVERIISKAGGEWGVDGSTNTAWFSYMIPPEDKMN
ncbi:MAG: ATP-binding protein [Candidatus Micrarchaeia archaeon]